jgi:hypothetical protein
MKMLIFLLAVLCLNQLALAVPRSMTLASPQKIEILNKEKLIRLTFELKCQSEYALDWSRVVMTNDDEGDQAVAIGLVHSWDNCKENDPMTKHELLVDPTEHGYSINNVPGGFQPMNLAR